MQATRRRLGLIVALALWGLMTHSTYAGQGDEPHYLVIAHSIAFDRDLDVSNNYGPREPLIGGGGLDPGGHARPGIAGTLRPVHDVGMPLLFAPYVAVAARVAARLAPYAERPLMRRFRLTPSIVYRHSISVAMIAVAVLLARLMFTVFVEAGVSERSAFWTALLIALSPPLMIFAVLFFTEMVSALLCLVVFRRAAIKPDAGAGQWGLTGVATGLLVLIHIKNAGIVLALVGIVVVTLLRQRLVAQLLAFGTGLAAALLLRTAITYRFWDSLLTTPHARAGSWQGWTDLASTSAVRLAGLMVDQEFGLLLYAPILMLAAIGMFEVVRTNTSLLWKLLLVVGCHLLVILLPVTNVHGWTGGWSPTARFLTPVVPLLAIPVALIIPRCPRPLLAMVIALQVTISAYMWQNPKNLWNDGDGVAAVCERGGATFCRYLPSFPER